MYNLTIIKSNIDKNKDSKNIVLFFHGFGAPCSKYNLTQWDNIKDEYYEDDEKIRKNNWLDNLVNVFNASVLIYYNRPEENFLFPNSSGKHNLSKKPNLHNHILQLQNQLNKQNSKIPKTPIITPDTKLYLVCHSIGCAYGLKYYDMFPSNIEGIILIDSYPLISKIITKYSNEKYIPSDNLLEKLKYKRTFSDNEKIKLIDYIFQDITTNFTDYFTNKINIKLLCFWNIDIKQPKNKNLSREFSNLLKSKSLKKNFKNIEFYNRDHYLNETDDIKINEYITKFML